MEEESKYEGKNEIVPESSNYQKGQSQPTETQGTSEHKGTAQEQGQKQTNNNCCNILSLWKITYYNLEIDAAIREGDLEALKAALGGGEQEDNTMEHLPETSTTLEELLAANNIDSGVFEEILEGLCQIEVPDFEKGYSSSQIENQDINTYDDRQLELSELGDEETFEENFS